MNRTLVIIILIAILTLTTGPTYTKTYTSNAKIKQVARIELEWNRTYGGPEDDTASKILVVEENGQQKIYVLGTLADKKMWILKLSVNGTVEQNITYNPEISYPVPLDIQMGPDGNIYAASLLGTKLAILKIYPNGTYEEIYYDKIYYGQQSIIPIHGDTWAAEDAIYIMTTASNLISNQSSLDILLIKLAYNGSIIWNITIGGETEDMGYAIYMFRNNIYITGVTKTPKSETTSENYDVLLASVDTDGKLSYTTTWGTKEDDKAYDLYIDQYGYIYITGESKGKILIMKYHTSGTLQYNKTLNITGSAYGIMVTGSHVYTTGYIAGGVTYNDLAVLRLDLAGNLVENITWKGNATDIGNGIYITQNEIYVAGTTQTNTTQPTDALIIKYKLPTLGPTQATGQGQNHITPIATTFIIFAILPIVLVTVSYKKHQKQTI